MHQTRLQITLDERKGGGHLEHWPGKTRISDALSKLYWKTKQDPIQEDLLRKTAVPKAQLQMTNPNTHHRIVDSQTKDKPIQEDSLRNEAGPSAQLQMTNSRTHHKILNYEIKQRPIQEDSFKKELGRRLSFKRQVQELVVRSSTFRWNRRPSKKTDLKKLGRRPPSKDKSKNSW